MLDPEAISTAAWYHASIYENWPPDVAADRDRALHLGPYEAAIDTMYYRMSHQDEADEPFYLHRVVLDPNAAIAPGIARDPGQPWTGFVPPSFVTAGGHVVRRYINDGEHRGSLALAVTLEAIMAVQTIAIPITSLMPPLDAVASTAASQFDVAVADADAELVRATAAQVPAAPHAIGEGLSDELAEIRKQILERQAAISLNRPVMERGIKIARASSDLGEALIATYLPNVSGGRRNAILEALKHQTTSCTGARLHELVRSNSSLFNRPLDVIAAVAARPPYRAPVLDAGR